MLIDARQAIGADRSPWRLLISVLVLHAASFLRAQRNDVNQDSGTFLGGYFSATLLQSLYQPPTLVPDYWRSLKNDKRTMEGNTDACRAVSRHELSRFTQNGRRRIKLKLAVCASFHFILEISWARWGS